MNKLHSIRVHLINAMALLVLCFVQVNGQSKLVLNGGILTIANGASLVVNDSNTDAVARVSGHIISEGELNKVIWNMNTAEGLYEVPFGYGATNYIPVSFTKTAGTGSGSFEFSTYRTATWQNSSDLPSLVGHLNNSSGSNNSAKVIDRFWQMNAVNYTVKPDLTDVTFTYLDAEHTVASNTITESNLQAQRWNSTDNSWGDFGPLGTVSTTNNTVFVSSILSSHLHEWWTLVDNSSPLPVEFVEFIVECNSENVFIEWSTASEINNDYFSVERSADAENWVNIETISGAGNSTQLNIYSSIDEKPLTNMAYYRVKQTDFNGNVDYSKTKAIECKEHEVMSVSIYPNPSKGAFTIEIPSEFVNEVLDIEIIDMYGKLIIREMISNGNSKVDISAYPKGVYFLRVKGEKGEFISEKLILQ